MSTARRNSHARGAPKALYAVRTIDPNGVILVGLKVRASDSDEDDLIGALTATPRPRRSVRFGAAADVDRACIGAPCSPSVVYEVDHVSLDDDLHQHGLGAWMFAEAARLAWSEKMAPIISTRAFGGSETSLSQRVWTSRRLAEHVSVSGMCGVWRRRGDASAPVPSLGDVRIIEPKARAQRTARRPPADVSLDVETYRARGFDHVNISIDDDGAVGTDGAQAVVGAAEDVADWLRDTSSHGASPWLADAIMSSSSPGDEVAYLYRLKVPTSMQRRGVGAAVLARLVESLRRRGTEAMYAVMELDGDTSASAVRRFLLAHGFEELPGDDGGRLMWRLRIAEERRGNPSANAASIITWSTERGGVHVGIKPLRPIRGNTASTRSGELNATKIGVGSLSDPCLASLEALNSERRVPATGVLVVEQSSLLRSMRKHGIGAWMYAEAARLAWLKHRSAIVASACDAHGGGTTSAAARGVWSGKKLRHYVSTEGLVGVWREDRDASVPVPPPHIIASIPRSHLDRRENPVPGRDRGAVDPETGVTEAELMALWGPVGRWIGGGEFNASTDFGRMFRAHARTLKKLRRRDPIEVWRASNGRHDEFDHPSAWTFDQSLAVDLMKDALEVGPDSVIGARSLLHAHLRPQDVWFVVPDLQAAADRMGLLVRIDSQGWSEVVAKSGAYTPTAADRKAFSEARAAGRKLQRVSDRRKRRAEAARVVAELADRTERRTDGRRANPSVDPEAKLRAVFERERRRFAAVYPHVASAALEISDSLCNKPGPCARRDIAFASWFRGPRGKKTRQKITLVRRALSMPHDNIVAVLRHELGHLCDPRAGDRGPGSEARADLIAEQVGGQHLNYDRDDLQTVGPGRPDRPKHLHQ